MIKQYSKLFRRAVFFVFGLCLSFPCAANHSNDPLYKEIIALVDNHGTQTGTYVLEKGEEALLARAWLAEHAVHTIEVQYFIWGTDNIGILAAEALLSAAERGVKVRVIVDDLLIDAPDKSLVALSTHPNVEIKIYNPNMTVGTSLPKKTLNALKNFRGVNQRMHNKTFIVDDVVGITGGRNMADEYFDFDRRYNFRDRDVLLLGPAVLDIKRSFDEYWDHPLAVAIDQLLDKQKNKLTQNNIQEIYRELHQHAADPKNFAPNVRTALQNIPDRFESLIKDIVWTKVQFISDPPGKNKSHFSLEGGGVSTRMLKDALSQAKERVVIQSPYLVLLEDGRKLFKELLERGVSVKINTNSLASTDNLMAYSGYRKHRQKLLGLGVQLYEFRPDAKVAKDLIDRLPEFDGKTPVFAIHAKTMVIDGKTVFIGTFNLDPRSANLNTEVGVLINHPGLAASVEAAIETDMRAENSWDVRKSNPDYHASFSKRSKLLFYRLLPMGKVL
ncbi:MAG: phospholipase D family protein [Gammaproteobacteria bacterium]|nr:phospholipase D family protein [Gammaproteobacteria bacterium]